MSTLISLFLLVLKSITCCCFIKSFFLRKKKKFYCSIFIFSLTIYTFTASEKVLQISQLLIYSVVKNLDYFKLGVGNVNNWRAGSKKKNKPQRAGAFRVSDLPDPAGSFYRSGSLFNNIIRIWQNTIFRQGSGSEWNLLPKKIWLRLDANWSSILEFWINLLITKVFQYVSYTGFY